VRASGCARRRPGLAEHVFEICTVGDQPFVDIYRGDPKGTVYTLRKTVALG